MTKFSKPNLALNNSLNKLNYTFGVEGLIPSQRTEVIGSTETLFEFQFTSPSKFNHSVTCSTGRDSVLPPGLV